MIISTDSEKAFDKIQLIFMVKMLNKLGIEVNFLDLKKVHLQKPTADIIVSGEKPRALALRWGMTRTSAPATSVRHHAGDYGQGKQARERKKRHSVWKGRVKLFLLPDDRIFL